VRIRPQTTLDPIPMTIAIVATVITVTALLFLAWATD
jgi:hypothetical protein